MRYLSLLVFVIIVCLPSRAQDIVITGTVKSDKGEVIPYATIKFRQASVGTVANQQGNFILKVSPSNKKDTIEFSCMGFQSELLAVAGAADKLIIVLKEDVYDLPIAQVDANGLQNIIQKTIENIPQNFETEPYTYPAFFRQHHIEEDKCVRLIEAAFDIYDPGYFNSTSPSQVERLKLLEMRKSKVYEMNNGQHGDHLADLIGENNVHYRIGTVLNEKALSFFEFSRSGDYDTESDVKEIRYFYKNPKNEKVVKGTIWLKGEKFAIDRIEETTYPNIEYSGPWARNTGGYDWIFREGKKVVQYKEVSGKMHLDSIFYYYKHDLIHPIFHTIDFTVEEYFQLWCGQPEGISEGFLLDREYRKTHDLYTKRYHYNPTFWENYPLYQQREFDEKLKSELEWKSLLTEQFLKNGVD